MSKDAMDTLVGITMAVVGTVVVLLVILGVL